MKIMKDVHKRQKQIADLIDNWVGEKRIAPLICKLNKLFKKDKVVFSSSRYDEKYYADYPIMVSGLYQSRFMGIPDCIYIHLSLPSDKLSVTMTPKGAKNLSVNVTKVLFHELRHRQQNIKRKYQIAPTPYKVKDIERDYQMMYLGSTDEIDAYAFETKFDNVALNKLRKAHTIGWRNSEAIFMYRKNFRDQDPKVWKKFLKKVYKNGNSLK